MIADANPQEKPVKLDFRQKQTVEFRAPDGSADIYLLMAGLTVAAHHGLTMEAALEFAEKTYVDVNIFDEEHKNKQAELEQLPTSCVESAEALEKHLGYYTKNGVFSENILQFIIKNLKAFNDKNLRQEIGNDEEKIMQLVSKFFHCG
jgi:glutamine synthetase